MSKPRTAATAPAPGAGSRPGTDASVSADINGASLEFAEALYFRYLDDPSSVDAPWRAYFEGLHDGQPNGARPGPSFSARSIFAGGPAAREAASDGVDWRTARAVQNLVDAYRERGHLVADVNPLYPPTMRSPELDPDTYGLTESQLDEVLDVTGIAGIPVATVREMLDVLRRSYCGHVSVEMGYLASAEAREWLAQRMERAHGHFELSDDEARFALERVTQAETFEQFLHTKFVGAKRFSLEGGEGLITLLDFAIDECAAGGTEQAFIGMAHRGRLNVLTHVLRKDPREIFSEFQDDDPLSHLGSGDVKYHKGTRSDTTTLSGKPIRIALNFNPSHLEFVYPVLTGRVYALQARARDTARSSTIPFVLHGDASVIGQGVVAETLNMARLPGYDVGGVVHVVVNNQIGFTTPWQQSRSSIHATAVAEIADAPVFRVNGDDLAALAWVARTAVQFRQRFKQDVFIDLMCFRKYGHNEGDEPNFTQPKMYERIRNHPGVRALFSRALVDAGRVPEGHAQQLADGYSERLNAALEDVREKRFTPSRPKRHGAQLWERYQGGRDADVPDVETQLTRERAVSLLRQISQVPEGFEPHRVLDRLLRARMQAADGERPLDWGMGEALAFASLLADAVPVRIDGQDAERGTFAHRHAVLHHQQTGETYVPLRNLGEGQGFFDVVNSPLSEQAVMGFDYGYSREAPDALVIWEAQFGDFANGAQVIIDQFLSAAEDKWGILSGLVLLLPHGFEGQGPEHSSARLERFLALCAQDNMCVANLTTPAQLFHALRRQVLRPLRKPLVIMTPKSLLRHKLCVSRLEAFTDGRFQRVIGDRGGTEHTGIEPGKARRVLLCTGKIYYDLASAREEQGIDDVAIVRLEQLYPLPGQALLDELSEYPDGTDLVWVQEEPWNMGAWYYMRARLPLLLGDRFPLRCLSRVESASPATGSRAAHELEQRGLVQHALTGEAVDVTPDTLPFALQKEA